MYTQEIQEKLIELFENTPEYVNVSFSEKYVNGVNTGEKCFKFSVPKKLPKDQVPSGELLPSVVQVDDKLIITDVIEEGPVKLLCSTTTINSCYNWCNDKPNCNQIINQPNNVNTIRPLKGGIGITSSHNAGTRGTLGCIAIDSITQSYVGLTNSHVVIGDLLFANYRDPNLIISNELVDDSFQPPQNVNNPSFKIGRVIRYQPFKPSGNGFNYVDAALISIKNDPSIFNSTESAKQYDITVANSFPFATTSEINNLNSSIELISVGGTSYVKQGSCGLRFAGFSTVNVGYSDVRGFPLYSTFTDVISFTRIDTSCPWPIYGGDSGSILIGNISGTWKIIGINFAGSPYIGYACRIDRVSQNLQIEQFTGGTYNFIDEDSIKFVTVSGLTENLTITCSGTTFWQAGIIGLDKPC